MAKKGGKQAIEKAEEAGVAVEPVAEQTSVKEESAEEAAEEKADEEAADEKAEDKPAEGKPAEEAAEPSAEATAEEAPPQPPRPLSPKQQIKKQVSEAFPTIEEKYIQTVLIASNYNLESSFNALLYLSDPSSVDLNELEAEAEAPPLPSRKSQLEQDELLAKQLDQQYNKPRAHRRHRQHSQDEQRDQQSQDERLYDDDEDDNIISNFVEKDLPVIKEQFNKNLEMTKSKLNTWVSSWKQQYQQSSEELNNKRINAARVRNSNATAAATAGNNSNNKKDLFDEEPQEIDINKFQSISLSEKEEQKKKWQPINQVSPEPIKLDNNDNDDDDFLASDDETKK